MSDTAAYGRNGREPKQVGVPLAAVVALCTAMAGGGAGSLATGQSVASEVKEFKAVVLGRFDQLEARFAEQSRNTVRLEGLITDHEKRLHSMEIEAARRGAAMPR